MTSLRDLDALATVHPAKGLERKDPRITESLRGQERCMWCWAAVAQFALQWAVIEKEQCEIASQQLGCGSEEDAPDCCPEGACDEMESLSVVLKRQGCLDKTLVVPYNPSRELLEDRKNRVLARLDKAPPEPVAFRVLVSKYEHFIVCNGLIGGMILIEDPCGPQYTCEPVESFLGRMLYNGDMDITHIYLLHKSDGTFKC